MLHAGVLATATHDVLEGNVDREVTDDGFCLEPSQKSVCSPLSHRDLIRQSGDTP